MGILLAAFCALTYGVADWCGGRAARRADALAVAVLGQATSLGLVILAVAVLADPLPAVASVAWGAAGGVAGLCGLVAFYEALSKGAMTVVAPITAVVSAAVPVAVGVALGERPGALAWGGIAAAVVAVALVSGAVGSRTARAGRREFALAGIAGLGFGLIFVFLDRSAPDSGLWPLVGARVASVTVAIPAFVVLTRHRPARVRLPRVALPLALTAGGLDMAANVLYLLATRHGLLSIVAVVSAMYPVSTVALAVGIDKERVNPFQVAGMVLAAGALALVSLG